MFWYEYVNQPEHKHSHMLQLTQTLTYEAMKPYILYRLRIRTYVCTSLELVEKGI